MPDGDRRRVVLLSPVPPPAGGIASWTRALLDGGVPGWDLDVVDTKLRERGLFDRSWRVATEARRSAAILTGLGRALRRRPALVHLCCSLSPAGVHRDLACLRLARARGVPVVVHFRGNVPDFAGGRAARAALARLAREATIAIALNEPSRGAVRDLGATDPVVLPNFVDDALLRVAREPAPEPTALYVGGLARLKGTDVLIEAARCLPDVRFELVGAVMDDVRDVVASAPPNVRSSGERPHGEVIDAMRRSTLLVLPSRTEGFPNAAVEAMALGLPVVASRVGALPEMLDDGGGGLVAPGDAGGLAAAVGSIVADPGLAATMGERNRRTVVARYARTRVVAGLGELWARACQQGGGAPLS